MLHVSLDRGRRRTLQIATAAVAATAVLAFAFTNLSTAQDRVAPSFAGPPSFADVVDYVSPAVVNISVMKVTQTMPTSGLRRLPPRGESPLDEFFGQFFGSPGAPDFQMPREREALGSGFVIGDDGYVATNRHVIESASEVFVTLQSGEKLPATIVGQDQQTDLALLKIDAPAELPTLRFGDSDRARVGDWVLAIGNPFGLGGTATAGIISARGRDIQSGIYDDYLQIDAPINQGNSGGPVFNAAGEVIGINTAIFSPNGGNIGIGFAIPSNQARAVIEELKENGSVSRGWLGVQIQDLDADLAEGLGLDDTDGALITDVVSGSPAQRAGLVPGDVVMEFDGKPVDSTKTLGRFVAEQDSGSRVSLTVWRDGQSEEIDVELGELDNPAKTARLSPAASDVGTDLGLVLQDLTQSARDQLGLDADTEGAVVARVAPGSTAAREGIEPGDVILQVNQQRIDSAADVLDELAAARAEGRRALLLVRRGDAQRFVALDFA
ncbi:MAG TPA: DegQ family serine endoprotease [Gammaproteobacteria bacterium]